MAVHRVKVTINGRLYEDEVEDRTLLVDFIRDLGLKGTHIGCDTGHCGACTIMLNGSTVKPCMMFAAQGDGADIMTIEGLAKAGELHTLQMALSANHALQCGYCTPGMIMSCLYLLRNNPHPSEREIRRALEGNLCRCTGYLNIIKAVKDAANRLTGRQR
jgi:carbon-monoxide dehydrogenase small subunit